MATKTKPQDKPVDAIRQYLIEIGRQGGLSRARRHTKSQLSRWAKMGGRPRSASKAKSHDSTKRAK